MKLIIFLTLLAAAYSQTIGPGVPDSRCPPGTPNPPLHFPDSSNCRRFHTCVNGLLTPRECPEGQHWSAANNWCDWPDRANCETRPNSCPPDNPMPPVHLPHESDCTRFYKCNWGNPVLMQCPPGQHWSVQHNWCDWPDRANCQGGTSTRTSTSGTTTTRRGSKSSSSEES